MAVADLETVQQAQTGERAEPAVTSRIQERERRARRAIEAYRAACEAEGKPFDEAEGWLVLVAALNVPE